MIKKIKSKALNRHHKFKETNEMKSDKRVKNSLKLLRKIVKKCKMHLRQRIKCVRVTIKHFMNMSFKMIKIDGLKASSDNKRTLQEQMKTKPRESLKRELTLKIELTQTIKKLRHVINL